MINRACEILSIKEDELNEFVISDPFNNGNVLSGFLCRRGDHRYGALVIFSVNGWSCEQIIFGTPKMHYPFDRNGDFRWPPIREVQAWEKIDGTNILAYWYRGENDAFVTFKTRLTPIVKDMQFGRFESMWRELLERDSWIQEVIWQNPDFNLSFELYGERNPITIQYHVPLATSLLFGVRRSDHAIKPPTYLVGRATNPELIAFDSAKGMTEAYNEIRNYMTKNNETNLVDEGIVLYAHIGEPSWLQFKCKPEQIEKIHWASGGIPRNAVWTTAINSYENNENPTIENLIELLKEEYSDTQINKSIVKVHNIYHEAKKHMELVATVNIAWEKARINGFDVTQDKSGTMRFLSQFFNRNDMRKVGTIVLKQAGLI